jgi:hypothetical protein
MPLPFRIEQRMTTPSKPGKAPRPVWVAVGLTVGYDDTFRDLGGRKWHGEWSFFDDPTNKLADAAPTSFAERMEAKQDRTEARAERYEGWAENATKRSDAAFQRSHDMMKDIPFGQPILIGHHSEKRDRNYRDRAWNLLGKGVEESKKADYLKERANAADTAAEKSVPFMVRRREEAFTKRRAVERTKADYLKRGATETPRCDAMLAEYDEQIAYWQAKIDAAGGVAYSRENVKKGDRVRFGWGWATVYRVNPKSVTVVTDVSSSLFTKTYGDILEHKREATND